MSVPSYPPEASSVTTSLSTLKSISSENHGDKMNNSFQNTLKSLVY